jgi:hypothetical protein
MHEYCKSPDAVFLSIARSKKNDAGPAGFSNYGEERLFPWCMPRMHAKIEK